MKLSLVEQETILLYNQAEKTAEVYTHDPQLMGKLERLAKKHPDQITQKDTHNLLFPSGVYRFGSRTVQNAAKLPVNGQKQPVTSRLFPKPKLIDDG